MLDSRIYDITSEVYKKNKRKNVIKILRKSTRKEKI